MIIFELISITLKAIVIFEVAGAALKIGSSLNQTSKSNLACQNM